MRRIAQVLLVIVMLLPARAAAQDQAGSGVVLGLPGSVGFVWQVNERLAIRPDISFGWITSETDAIDLDGTRVSAGISLLVNVKRWDRLSTYFAPRYAFGRETGSLAAASGSRDSARHQLSGVFGARYRFTEHIAGFGEGGIAYDLARQSDVTGEASHDRSNRAGRRTGIGIIFFF